MDNEEYQFSQQVIAESVKPLIVQALEESIEDLREENARLRNTNRILRKVNSTLRGKVTEIWKGNEELQVHLFETVAALEIEDADSIECSDDNASKS